MADAQDLKSWDRKKSCGFESHHRHQLNKTQWNQWLYEIDGQAIRQGITSWYNVATIIRRITAVFVWRQNTVFNAVQW